MNQKEQDHSEGLLQAIITMILLFFVLWYLNI